MCEGGGMKKLLYISAAGLAIFIIFLIVDSQMKDPILINKLIRVVYPDWNPETKKGEAEEGAADNAGTADVPSEPSVVEVPITGGRTPVMDAVLKGSEEEMKRLILSGADINKQDGMGNTALNLAVFLGNQKAVEALLVNGANPNIADVYGMTPTANASRQRQFNLAKMLLERGANPNRANEEGQTPLIIASKYGFEDVADLLIKHNANVNAKDKLGRTALMEAASNGYTRVVISLLSMGADKNARDNIGQTAQDYAFRFGHEDIAVLLQDNPQNMVGEPVEEMPPGVTGNGAVLPPVSTPDAPPVQ